MLRFGPRLGLYSPLRLAGRSSPQLGWQATRGGALGGTSIERGALDMDIRIDTELRIGVHYLGASTGPGTASFGVWLAEAAYHTRLQGLASAVPVPPLVGDRRLHCLRLLYFLYSIATICFLWLRVLYHHIGLGLFAICTFLLQKGGSSQVRHSCIGGATYCCFRFGHID